MAWHAFDTESIRIWFDTQIYRKYNAFLETSSTSFRKKLKTSKTGEFVAMMHMDELRRPETTSKVELDGLSPILKLIAEEEAGEPAREFKFNGGQKSHFSNYIVQRSKAVELYVDTKPSAYEKVVAGFSDQVSGGKKPKQIPGIAGTRAQQARTVRRLLKGYNLNDPGNVVRDIRLERIAAIWGVSETFRNPAIIGHFLIVLYLIKKGKLTWEEAIDPTNESHFIASEDLASAKLQTLRKVTLAKIVNDDDIPGDMRTFARPLRTNIGKFLIEAAATAQGDVETQRTAGRRIRASLTAPLDEVEVRADTRDDADGFIDTIFVQKILRHFG